jgi:ATP-binding cassette, subfamily B, bacterial
MRFPLRRADFPFYPQLYTSDCGPACLRMIARHHGRHYRQEFLRERSFLTRQGVSLLGLGDAASAIGMRSLAVRIPFDKLKRDAPLPCIAHWRQNHFVVVHGIEPGKVRVADPGRGLITYSEREFMEGWAPAGDRGLVLLLEPTDEFHRRDSQEERRSSGLGLLVAELRQHHALLGQVLLGMVVASVLQLVFPFLTQALVDFGINNRNMGFVYAILLSQLMVFTGRAAIELVRSRILSHIGARTNVSLISDFLRKLTRLPLSFFETRLTADLLQRVADQRRISALLSTSALDVLFSSVTFVVFGAVLLAYSRTLLFVFLAGAGLVAAWVIAFTRRRRELDRKRFGEQARSQSGLIEIIGGMAEIKLNGAETQKRWEWERLQASLFRTEMAALSVFQYQHGGMLFLNELKNILISVLAAKQVVDGQMTLGMMMAVSYIIGQLNAPIAQLMTFIDAAQDATLSLDRLAEVHAEADEQTAEVAAPIVTTAEPLASVGVSFQYEGPQSEWVLRDLDLEMPAGRVTAVVGASGSGKTTLLKLLLRLYEPTRGQIRLGGVPAATVPLAWWRRQCGVVMQDGFIFADTIAANIALGDDRIDAERLRRAVDIARVADFANALPLGLATRIGAEGSGLSQGQKQRILIARAVYKDPAYLLFDEATSALDASNERSIMTGLEQFFAGRTVVIVAHRLSTVKRADQIVVLDKGAIVECGTHNELVDRRGSYYRLVKDQLELGA